MRNKKRGISFGSVLMILLTVVVAYGSFSVLRIMGNGKFSEFNAMELVSAVRSNLAATDAPMSTPAPQSTIKTTAVTLAPQLHEAETETPLPIQQSLTLTFGGQTAFQSDVSSSVYGAQTGHFDYVPVLQGIGDQIYNNLNMVMLSNLFNEAEGQYADIQTVPQAAQALQAIGVDHVALNHAHILDKGEEGLSQTVRVIEQSGMYAAGVRNFDDNGHIQLVTVNGIRVALLGYAENVSSRTKENMQNGTSLSALDVPSAQRDIAQARVQGADLVVVSLWWGNPDATAITERQRDIARQLCSAGADIIVGNGPDAVMPVEWMDAVTSKGEIRRALVAYSMGTLLSEKRDTRAQVSGMLLHMRVSVDVVSDKVTFDAVTYTPTYIWKQEVNGSVQFRVINSSQTPPEAMSDRQKEIMGRAYTLIEQTMQGSPAVRRGE